MILEINDIDIMACNIVQGPAQHALIIVHQ